MLIFRLKLHLLSCEETQSVGLKDIYWAIQHPIRTTHAEKCILVVCMSVQGDIMDRFHKQTLPKPTCHCVHISI